MDYKFTDDEVIKDLSTFRSGKYAIIGVPSLTSPDQVDKLLQVFSSHRSENWTSLEGATTIVCKSLDDRLTTLLEAKRRGLDAAQMMGLLSALTESVSDLMAKKDSYDRCMAIGTQYKGHYKGLHLETMCLQLPPRIAQAQAPIVKVQGKRSEAYYVFMEIVRASLPRIIERFSKNIRLARDDPWKPVNDLLYPYEK